MSGIAAELIGALKAGGQTVAVAESCTGGLIGARLTAESGASEVFWGGVISYDDAAKRALLGVSSESLETDGAVSESVALQMAEGVRRVAGTTWAIAVTGIAGPTGGTEEKPVGTVWIALDGPSGGARLHRFEGSRADVREATADAAMKWLLSCVL